MQSAKVKDCKTKDKSKNKEKGKWRNLKQDKRQWEEINREPQASNRRIKTKDKSHKTKGRKKVYSRNYWTMESRIFVFSSNFCLYTFVFCLGFWHAPATSVT